MPIRDYQEDKKKYEELEKVLTLIPEELKLSASAYFLNVSYDEAWLIFFQIKYPEKYKIFIEEITKE
jgi:hypothetical protein